MNTYIRGNLIRLSAAFANAAGTALDPSVVKCAVLPPGATTATEYTYGTDGALVKAATGSYYVDVSASTEGRWRYRWYSTGTGQAADEDEFEIAPTAF